MSDWTYDEYKHCGVNYADAAKAGKYDEQHQTFRNYEKEFESMLDFLELKNIDNLSMIDLGCGTGATCIYAANKFKKVFGVDVSDEMIRQAKIKAAELSSNNLEFIKAGFLTYEPKEPVDLLTTKAAFHHLPDFWKQIALQRMNRMIKPGGILYIFDVVFHFDATEYKAKIDSWIDSYEEMAGKEFRKEVETHIRDEYSTFKWVLDQMIENAGFRIEKCRTPDGFITEYKCVKFRELN